MTTQQTTPDLDLFYGLCAATVRHACGVLRQCGMEPNPRHIVHVVNHAPRSQAEVQRTEPPRKSSTRALIEKARKRVNWKGWNEQDAALREAELHFLRVIPSLAPAERDRLEAAVNGVIHGMFFGKVKVPVWTASGVWEVEAESLREQGGEP